MRMGTNEARTAEDLERLTWKQMCERFPEQWVVVADADRVNEIDLELMTAVVLGNFKRRKDASPRIKTAFADYSEIGCYWTGKIRGPIPRFTLP
jgi:hypothetical protein